MRIEILVGSEDPIIIPLNSARITIGSGESCDYRLEASGISRKHIVISTEDDQFFVIDQGSTNGSFINEERLVPGKRTEFTSFFPVRLGDNVLVSLLSDEDELGYSNPPPKEKTSPNVNLGKVREDNTTVIKLNDLKKASTEKLVLERNQKREVRKTQKIPAKVEKKKSIGIIPLTAVLIFLVAGYYNFFVKDSNKSTEPVHQVGKVVEVEKIPEAPKPVSDAIPVDELPKAEAFLSVLNDIKCATDEEKYLCRVIPGANENQWGVGQLGLTFRAVIDGTYYINEARQVVKAPTDGSPDDIVAYEKIINKVAAFIFLMRKLPLLDETILRDKKVAVGFFDTSTPEPSFKFAVAFMPNVFNREKKNLKESDLFLIKNNGEIALKRLENHFTIY